MPKKKILPFCTICQKLLHGVPEHGAVPGESDNRLNRPLLVEQAHPATKLESMAFLGRLQNAMNVAHCKLQDTTPIPHALLSLFHDFSPYLCLF